MSVVLRRASCAGLGLLLALAAAPTFAQKPDPRFRNLRTKIKTTRARLQRALTEKQPVPRPVITNPPRKPQKPDIGPVARPQPPAPRPRPAPKRRPPVEANIRAIITMARQICSGAARGSIIRCAAINPPNTKDTLFKEILGVLQLYLQFLAKQPSLSDDARIQTMELVFSAFSFDGRSNFRVVDRIIRAAGKSSKPVLELMANIFWLLDATAGQGKGSGKGAPARARLKVLLKLLNVPKGLTNLDEVLKDPARTVRLSRHVRRGFFALKATRRLKLVEKLKDALSALRGREVIEDFMRDNTRVRAVSVLVTGAGDAVTRSCAARLRVAISDKLVATAEGLSYRFIDQSHLRPARTVIREVFKSWKKKKGLLRYLRDTGAPSTKDRLDRLLHKKVGILIGLEYVGDNRKARVVVVFPSSGKAEGFVTRSKLVGCPAKEAAFTAGVEHLVDHEISRSFFFGSDFQPDITGKLKPAPTVKIARGLHYLGSRSRGNTVPRTLRPELFCLAKKSIKRRAPLSSVEAPVWTRLKPLLAARIKKYLKGSGLADAPCDDDQEVGRNQAVLQWEETSRGGVSTLRYGVRYGMEVGDVVIPWPLHVHDLQVAGLGQSPKLLQRMADTVVGSLVASMTRAADGARACPPPVIKLQKPVDQDRFSYRHVAAGIIPGLPLLVAPQLDQGWYFWSQVGGGAVFLGLAGALIGTEVARQRAYKDAHSSREAHDDEWDNRKASAGIAATMGALSAASLGLTWLAIYKKRNPATRKTSARAVPMVGLGGGTGRWTLSATWRLP